MKILPVSDVHVANWKQGADRHWFQKDFVPAVAATDAEVLVIAGDFGSLVDGDLYNETRTQLTELAMAFKHVVYVPGNHEFWGTTIMEGLQNLLRLEREVPRLHALLEGRTVEIDGKRFHGGTMWQPHSGSLYEASRKSFVDGRMIGDFYAEAPARFELLMKYLARECRPGDVVVTHHSPSMGSVDAPWVGHRDNRFFITPEAEEQIIMSNSGPALWIHGHVHSTWDYTRKSTRIIANPVGYPGEGVRFNPQLVVEL